MCSFLIRMKIYNAEPPMHNINLISRCRQNRPFIYFMNCISAFYFSSFVFFLRRPINTHSDSITFAYVWIIVFTAIKIRNQWLHPVKSGRTNLTITEIRNVYMLIQWKKNPLGMHARTYLLIFHCLNTDRRLIISYYLSV